jgi:hypothetical protein
LVVSFFAKIRKARWAVIVLVCTFVQIALGACRGSPIGALHGAVALVLFESP